MKTKFLELGNNIYPLKQSFNIFCHCILYYLFLFSDYSDSFFFVCVFQITMSFEVRRGLHISGVSPEMLSDYLTEFTDCGTFYKRLAVFSEAPVINSFYTRGLVFQAFTVAVRKALMYFTASVLNTPTSMELLELKKYLHHSMEQIRYLAKLCHCYEGPPKFSDSGDGKTRQVHSDFPTGMNLLSYLYDEASIAMNSTCYPLLLSIFQTTCAPFILFIQDWVFHGVLRGSYDEFMIKVSIASIEISWLIGSIKFDLIFFFLLSFLYHPPGYFHGFCFS